MISFVCDTGSWKGGRPIEVGGFTVLKKRNFIPSRKQDLMKIFKIFLIKDFPDGK